VSARYWLRLAVVTVTGRARLAEQLRASRAAHEDTRAQLVEARLKVREAEGIACRLVERLRAATDRVAVLERQASAGVDDESAERQRHDRVERTGGR
jgi:hypothetical protein